MITYTSRSDLLPLPRLMRSNGDNSFCVPAALSILTSQPVSQMTELLKEYIGDAPIRGIYIGVTVKILQQLGYSVRRLDSFDECDLARASKLLVDNTLYLCTTRGHAFVLFNECLIDNQNPDGIRVMSYPGKRRAIEMLFEVIKNQ